MMSSSFQGLLRRYGMICGSRFNVSTPSTRQFFTGGLSNLTNPTPSRRQSSRSNLLLYGLSSAALYSASTNFQLSFSTQAMADYATGPAAKLSMASPDLKPSSTLPEVVLYQYEVCPFCSKVRAYLDFHNIPYKVVEVDPLWKTELKQFSNDYRKVPIALINGKQINGSFEVINHINGVVHGEEAKLSDEEVKWVKWLDDYFIHLIAPNIYRSPKESLQTFDYIVNNAKFSIWQKSTIRYSGASIMYMVGKKIKKKYEITDEREEIHRALKEWTDEINKSGGKFFNGKDEPGIMDLSLYGVLRAIYTFDTFAEISQENSDLKLWFDRTSQAIGDSCVTQRE